MYLIKSLIVLPSHGNENYELDSSDSDSSDSDSDDDANEAGMASATIGAGISGTSGKTSEIMAANEAVRPALRMESIQPWELERSVRPTWTRTTKPTVDAGNDASNIESSEAMDSVNSTLATLFETNFEVETSELSVIPSAISIDTSLAPEHIKNVHVAFEMYAMLSVVMNDSREPKLFEQAMNCQEKDR